MASREALFQAAIARKTDPLYMSDKAQIIEYYRDKYPGQKVDKRGNVTYEWKSRIVSDLMGIATNKKGEAMSRANIARRFQAGRENQLASGKGKQEYAALGQKLEPIGRQLRNNQITITVKGRQSLGRNKGTRERSYTATLTGGDALSFANDPSLRDILQANGYPDDVIDMMEDGDYELEIYDVA